MKLKRRSGFATIIIIILFGLISCTNSSKNKFLGKWIEAKYECDSITIDKNGNDYIVTYQDKRLPAVYKDGNLEVTINGLHPKMMLDERTDRILFMDKEWIKFEKSFTSKICGKWGWVSESSGNDENKIMDTCEIVKDNYGLKFNSKKSLYINCLITNIYIQYKDSLFYGKISTKYWGRICSGATLTDEFTIKFLNDNQLKMKSYEKLNGTMDFGGGESFLNRIK